MVACLQKTGLDPEPRLQSKCYCLTVNRNTMKVTFESWKQMSKSCIFAIFFLLLSFLLMASIAHKLKQLLRYFMHKSPSFQEKYMLLLPISVNVQQTISVRFAQLQSLRTTPCLWVSMWKYVNVRSYWMHGWVCWLRQWERFGISVSAFTLTKGGEK